VKAHATFEEHAKQHNARLFSLSQKYDTIFRANKITKEHYHGGKYDGVNRVRIMEKSEDLFTAFAAVIKLNKILTVDDAAIDLKCQQYGMLLGLLDGIWSHVRGIDSGLLPTEVQLQMLEKRLSKAKALWLQMDIGTKQPTWHMTFDGHLLHQCRLCCGIADKSDESIELQHQVIKRLKDRCRSVTSYQRREACIFKSSGEGNRRR